MVATDLPPALQSPWAHYVLRNRVQDIFGSDVERRWADDLISLGMASDAVISLAILRDEEWREAGSLVEAILRELSIDPDDKAQMLRFIRAQITLAIKNGADVASQVREGMLLASESHGLPGYDGCLDVFYWIEDEIDLVAFGLKSDPSLHRLGPRAWTLKQLADHN